MSARQLAPWTPAAKDRVRSLWVAGKMTGAEIAGVAAAEFGFPASKSAVIGIAFRSGLAFKGRPVKACTRAVDRAAGRARQEAAREASRRRRADAKAAREAGVAKPTVRAKAPTRPVMARPSAVSQSLRIPLVEAREGECRFIADDPRDGSATCCGHPCASGSPWCEPHRALCTVRPGGKPSSVWVPRHLYRRAA